PATLLYHSLIDFGLFLVVEKEKVATFVKNVVQLNIPEFDDKGDTNSPDEVRKIKVKEEQERRKQIIQSYTKLKEQLPVTLHKTSNAKLLKKAAKYIARRTKEVNNLEAKLDQLNTICTDLNIELECIKK
ncbi:29951_t:CDS:2, partial [Gigaspora margarita]